MTTTAMIAERPSILTPISMCRSNRLSQRCGSKPSASPSAPIELSSVHSAARKATTSARMVSRPAHSSRNAKPNSRRAISPAVISRVEATGAK